MNFNEVVDDEVGEDEVPAVAEPEKPKGDFSRVLSGREIWFNSPIPGQFRAWRRYQESLGARFEAIKVRAQKAKTIRELQELTELSEKFDLSTLGLVESLLVDPDDADFIAMEMISGRVTVSDIHQVLFGDPAPEDDQEPERKPRKAARKTANVKRTKK